MPRWRGPIQLPVHDIELNHAALGDDRRTQLPVRQSELQTYGWMVLRFDS